MGHVLVVDDDACIRELLEDLLECEGIATVVAADGQEALERIAEGQPALIISDMMMPRVDGVRLCAELRANPATAETPIVIMTAGRHDPPPGVMATLYKPFDLRRLLALVQQCLGSVAQNVPG